MKIYQRCGSISTVIQQIQISDQMLSACFSYPALVLLLLRRARFYRYLTLDQSILCCRSQLDPLFIDEDVIWFNVGVDQRDRQSLFHDL